MRYTHILINKIDSEMCDVLPALHNLTGGDTNSKIGTKYVAIKSNLIFYSKNLVRIYLILNIQLLKQQSIYSKC